MASLDVNRPHGEFSLVWRGEVLVAQWHGTFNREAMVAYIEQITAMVEAERPERWGRLVDLRDWDGITPDALAEFYRLSQWIKKTHCVAQVQVFSNRFFQRIAAKVADALAPDNLRMVFSMEEAIAFLTESGLRIEGKLPD